MICPNCDEKIPFDRDLKMARLNAQDGMEADLWQCPHCDQQFVHIIRGPWQISYEDHMGHTRKTLQIGYTPNHILAEMAVRVLGWKLLNAVRSSTYD